MVEVALPFLATCGRVDVGVSLLLPLGGVQAYIGFDFAQF